MNILNLILFCTLLCIQSITAAYADPVSVRVGLISGLSGAAAKWNRYQNLGIEMAKEDLEAEGISITLIVEDAKTEAPRAITAFNKLVDFDKVDAILANDFGFAVAPLLPLIKQRRVFSVALSLPHDHYCSQAQGLFYSSSSQLSLSAPAFETFFELHPEVRRIALINFDDQEWGNTYRSMWMEIAARRGVDIVDTYRSSEFVPDFKTVLTKMLPKKPQAIFLAHEPESFFKALRQLRYQGLVVTANNALEMLADSQSPRPELEEVYLVDPIISAEFRERFKRRFKLEPILEAYAGYESLRSIAKAFQGNAKAPGAGLRAVRYEGVAGPIDFTGKTCAGNFSHWGLFQFSQGQIKRVAAD